MADGNAKRDGSFAGRSINCFVGAGTRPPGPCPTRRAAAPASVSPNRRRDRCRRFSWRWVARARPMGPARLLLPRRASADPAPEPRKDGFPQAPRFPDPRPPRRPDRGPSRVAESARRCCHRGSGPHPGRPFRAPRRPDANPFRRAWENGKGRWRLTPCVRKVRATFAGRSPGFVPPTRRFAASPESAFIRHPRGPPPLWRTWRGLVTHLSSATNPGPPPSVWCWDPEGRQPSRRARRLTRWGKGGGLKKKRPARWAAGLISLGAKRLCTPRSPGGTIANPRPGRPERRWLAAAGCAGW